MSFASKSLVAAIVGAVSVAAHGHVQSVSVAGGESVDAFPLSFYYANPTPDGVGWHTTATDNGFVPVADINTSDMACHLGGKPGTISLEIAAGETMNLQWDTWPESHKGPVIDYLAPCPAGGCTTATAESLAFTKIAQDGADTQNSGAMKLIANGNSWDVTIPADLKAGEYVLRHEIIALHGVADPQFYPQCINLIVSGSGSTELPSGTSGAELYDSQEEGLLWSLYNGDQTSYPFPGPALMAGGSSGSPTTPTNPPTASGVAEPSTSVTPPASSGGSDDGETGGEYEPPAAPKPTDTASVPGVPSVPGTPGSCLRKRGHKARRAAKLARRNALRK